MKTLILIAVMSLSLICKAQDDHVAASTKTDSVVYYKAMLNRVKADLSSHSHAYTDSVITAYKTEKEDYKERLKVKVESNAKLEKQLKASRNTSAECATNLVKTQKKVVSFELDSITKAKKILNLEYEILTLKEDNNEIKAAHMQEKNIAINRLDSLKAIKDDIQEDLDGEIEEKEATQVSLNNLYSKNADLLSDMDSMAGVNLFAKMSIAELKASSQKLQEEKNKFEEKSSTLLIALFVGIAIVMAIFFYIIYKIARPDGIDKQSEEISKQLKAHHPMLKETITHYLNYKLYSGIMKTALILVASTTILLMAGVVVIYYLAPETNQLVGDGFWEILSSVVAPLVVTITIFSALEQKKIDTAKTLLEHSNADLTSIP